MSIVEFLRARYEERRAIALAATPGPWEHVVDDHGRGQVDASVWADSIGYYVTEKISSGEGHITDAQHIAAHGPDVVLADLDAKLAILDEHQDVNDGDCGTCVNGRWGYPTHGGSSPQRYPCRTLRLLAVPFAAHPDYNERWRP